LSPHLDDLALSLLLDGEEVPDGAHVEACVVCSARLDSLRRAAKAVGSAPPSPPPGALEQAVIAALATPAFGPRSRSRRIAASARTRIAASAAAAVIVAVGVAAAISVGSSGSRGSVTQRGALPTLAAPAGSIGSFASQGALASALRARLSAQSFSLQGAGALPPAAGAAGAIAGAAGAAGAPGATATAPATPTCSVGSASTFHAPLVFAGRDAEVYVITSGHQRQAVVLSVPGCQVLTRFAF
jgi:hypothetical protein